MDIYGYIFTHRKQYLEATQQGIERERQEEGAQEEEKQQQQKNDMYNTIVTLSEGKKRERVR